jgi:hypothetical protein
MMQYTRRYALALAAAVLLEGCASVPGDKPIDMSSFSKPTAGTAGVYFFRLKLGIIGAAGDADFVLDGKLMASINTGDYGYFEVPAGKHKYQLIKGPLTSPAEIDFDFQAGQNYFFRGDWSAFTTTCIWVNNPTELEQVTQFIRDGVYKKVSAGPRPTPIQRWSK